MAIVTARFKFMGPQPDQLDALASPGASVSEQQVPTYATWKYDDTVVATEDLLDAMSEMGWVPSVETIGSPIVLVYRPGGTTQGAIWADWTQLMAAYALTDGPAIIEIDDSLVSPALIPAGTWAFRPDTTLRGHFGWNALSGLNSATLQAVDGCVFNPPPLHIENGLVLDSVSTQPVITFPGAGGSKHRDQLNLLRGVTVKSSGAAPFIRSSNTDGQVIIGMAQGCTLDANAVDIQGDLVTPLQAYLLVNALGESSVAAGAISSNAQGELSLVSDASCSISLSQPGYTGGAALDNTRSVNSRRLVPSIVHDATTIGTYTVRPGSLIQCDPLAAGPMALTLPSAAGSQAGAEIVVKNSTASPNAITINPLGVDTIDGAPSLVLASPFAVARLISDGASNWIAL